MILMKTIFYIIGLSGSGKTWLANKVKHLMPVFSHDAKNFQEMVDSNHQTCLFETPVMWSTYYKNLKNREDIKVIPIAIGADFLRTKQQILSRGGKITPNLYRRHERLESIAANYNIDFLDIEEALNIVCKFQAKKGVVYCATFSNGKVYVGQAQDLEKRIRHHKWRALKDKINEHLPFYRAWRKYGEPVFSVLEEATISNIDYLEEKWIKKLNSNSKDIGYNLTGGIGSKGRILSQESKNKISVSNKKNRAEGGGKREFTLEDRARSAELARKYLHTQQVRDKLSIAKIGKPSCITAYGKAISKIKNSRPIVRSDGLKTLSILEMADLMNTRSTMLMRVLNGQFKQHKGYSFKYIDSEDEILAIKKIAIEAVRLKSDHIEDIIGGVND
jgi:group I intron endonuclease